MIEQYRHALNSYHQEVDANGSVSIDEGREAHVPFAQNHGMKPWDRVQFQKPGCLTCGPHYVSSLASWRVEWEA